MCFHAPAVYRRGRFLSGGLFPFLAVAHTEIPAEGIGAPLPPKDIKGENGVSGHQNGGGEGDPGGDGGEEH